MTALVLELERDLPAAPAVVFRVLTDHTMVARWWGPSGFSVPHIDWEPRAGQAYRIEMQPPGGDPFALHGHFREVDTPRRLSFTFIWDPPDPDDVETLAELSLTDLGERTRLQLRQGEFKTQARFDLHHDGWGDTLDRLGEVLREQPQPAGP